MVGQETIEQVCADLQSKVGAETRRGYCNGQFAVENLSQLQEALADGLVELSQKAFTEPQGKNCPNRFVAIMPRASWLKAGQTVKEQLSVAWPLRLNTPFDDCRPPAEMPKEVSKVRFCVGVAEADSKKVTIAPDGNLSDLSVSLKQQVLCSEAVALK